VNCRNCGVKIKEKVNKRNKALLLCKDCLTFDNYSKHGTIKETQPKSDDIETLIVDVNNKGGEV